MELMDANKKTVEGLYIPPKTFSIIENLLDYNAFFRQYLETNTPCLIRAKSIMEKWQSCSDWIDSEKQIPNLDFFKKLLNINEHTVPVSNCGQKYFNSQEKCDMSFESFLKYWNKPREDSELNCFYLKDWHFVKEVPQYKPYQTPEYFSSDWLNEYLENSNQNHSVTQDFKKSDYKFVYIGPKGSWTPFHSDVFGSYSWSANVVGEKEWIFFGSEEQYWEFANKVLRPGGWSGRNVSVRSIEDEAQNIQTGPNSRLGRKIPRKSTAANARRN